MPQTEDPAGSLLSLPPPRLPREALLALAQTHWGLTGTLTPLTSERDLNHRLDTPDGKSFTLKLANPAEPAAMTAFQTRALLHVAATTPTLPVPRVLPASDGRHIITLPEGALRLLTWCPGTPVAHLPRSPALARATGTALARLTAALDGFDDAAADHPILWDIRQAPRLAALLPALQDADLRAEAARFLARFETRITPRLARLPARVIHADFNPHNLLADPDAPDHLTGIIDFGDLVRSHRVCDLATACAYQVDTAAPLRLVIPLVAAFHATEALTPEEIALLPDLISARMLATLTIGAWRAARYPENAAYILRNAASARAGLAALRASDPALLAHQILAACESPDR